MKRSLLFLSLFAIIASSAFGQQSKPGIEKEPEVLPVSFNESNLLEKIGEVEVSYFPRELKTKAETGYMDLIGSDGSPDRMALKLGFGNKGKGLLRPKEVHLTLDTYAETRKYYDNASFKILAEGRVLYAANSEINFARRRKKSLNVSLQHFIPYEKFVELSKAGALSFQVGPTKIDLKEEHRTALTDLLKTVKPDAQTVGHTGRYDSLPITLWPANPAPMRRLGTAAIVYFRDKDEVFADTEWIVPLITKDWPEVKFRVEYSNRGKVLKKPESIRLVLITELPEDSYSGADFRILSGTRVLFEKRQAIEKAETYSFNKKYHSNTTIEIPYKSFVEISRAPSLTLNIGRSKLLLRPSARQEFSGVLQLIGKTY